MASSYSTSLKIQLMGNGEDSGTWGSITNTNWNLMEEAVAGVVTITMANANYTLTNLNGVTDEARNMVLVVTGTNSAIYQVVAPLAKKVYVVSNQTVGGYAITIGGATGSVITVPNGVTAQVYCDGTNFFSSQTGSAGDFTINGNEYLAGNLTFTGSGKKITGDFNSTSRIVVQNLTTNSETAFTAVPNGTGGSSNIGCTNAPDLANTSSMFFRIDASVASIYSYKTGTGTYLPLNFNINGAEQMRITTAGGVSFGSSGTNYGTAGQVLVSQGNASPIWYGGAVPPGGIIMWSGSIGSIPSGWYLCNGANGTPNLQDRFVIGAGNAYSVGATGGTTTVTLSTTNLPSHTHTYSGGGTTVGVSNDHTHSISDPGHYHGLQDQDGRATGVLAYQAGSFLSPTSGNSANVAYNTTSSTTGITGTNGQSANHTHAFSFSGTTNATGSGTGFSILNPYYALAFIMKA